MAQDKSGYIFQDKDSSWYARTTIMDSTGKRRNVKRRALNKRNAKELLKSILQELEAAGTESVDRSRLTFEDLADFYATNYCKPAEYVSPGAPIPRADVPVALP